MHYTAVSKKPNGDARAQCALATLDNVYNLKGWKLHGPIFPNIEWSKSGVIVIQEQLPHYLFFGDTNIFVATSNDLLSYNFTGIPLEKYLPY